MGQIHQDAFEEEEVLGFVAEAHRFCDLFERLSSLGRLYLLQQLNESLPLLYSMAHRLPDPYNWDEIERDEAWEAEDRRGMPLDEHTAKWSEWSERLRGKLTNHKLFRLVYDPVDPRDREIIECGLAGILTEVYLDMKDGLILFGRGSDERHVRGGADLGEFGVLREESVSRMDGIRARDLRGRDDTRDAKIGFARWRRPDVGSRTLASAQA